MRKIRSPILRAPVSGEKKIAFINRLRDLVVQAYEDQVLTEEEASWFIFLGILVKQRV